MGFISEGGIAKGPPFEMNVKSRRSLFHEPSSQYSSFMNDPQHVLASFFLF